MESEIGVRTFDGPNDEDPSIVFPILEVFEAFSSDDAVSVVASRRNLSKSRFTFAAFIFAVGKSAI